MGDWLKIVRSGQKRRVGVTSRNVHFGCFSGAARRREPGFGTALLVGFPCRGSQSPHIILMGYYGIPAKAAVYPYSVKTGQK